MGRIRKNELVTTLTNLATEHQTLLKYLVIGGTASLIDVLLFALFFNLVGTSALIAHSISVPTAIVFSFIVNARHNFRTDDYLLLRFTSFVIVCCVGFLIGYAIIRAAQFVGWGGNIGKLLSLPAVFIIQFILNSRITFRKATVVAEPLEA